VSTYLEPERLGADRWHAMLGARSLQPGQDLLVVCAGTAVTADAVSGDGRFLGGTITPGPTLQLESLAHGTARLPAAAGTLQDFPATTVDAIHTGVLEGLAGLLERRARAMRSRLGADPLVLLSGGAAGALEPLLRAAPGLGKIVAEPDLVLRGLWVRAAHEGTAGEARTSPGS